MSLALEYKYELSIGDDILYFTSIEGGGWNIDVISYNKMDHWGGSTTIYIPGTTAYEPLTLSYGITNTPTLLDWWTKLGSGEIDRRSGTLTAFDESGYKKMIWHLTDMWPSKVSGFTFDSRSSNIYLESVTLVVEGISHETPSNDAKTKPRPLENLPRLWDDASGKVPP